MQVNGYTEKDFQDTEIGPIPADWNIQPLKELGIDFYGGGTPSTKREEFWNGDIAWVTSAYIDDNLYLDKCAGYITQAGLSNSSTKLVSKGNLLIGTRVGVGKAAINLLDTAISQDLTAMLIDHSAVSVEFLAYAIKSEPIQNQILSGARGTTIKGIPRADLVQVPIPVPPITEQRRIAAVLNAIQDEIAAQDDIITEAREFKRSLMQRLFTFGPGSESAETKETELGETPAHWEVAELGEFVLGTPQNGLYKPLDLYGSEGTPILRINDYGNDGLFVSLAFRRVQLEETEVERYLLRPGDIVINRVNSLSHLGKPALIPILPEPSVFESNMMRLSLDKEKLLPEYAIQALLHPTTREQMRGKSKRAVAQSSINQGDVKSLLIPVPSHSEQGEIAATVADLDEKTATEEDRKAAMQDFFKSMLHQLMTGQIRLLIEQSVQKWTNEMVAITIKERTFKSIGEQMVFKIIR